MRTELSQPWVLTATGGAVDASVAGVSVAATVPGCVHTDLLAAELIPDPYLDQNETAVGWIGRTSWRYAVALDLPVAAPGERVELLFGGLDTVCEVSVGGRVLASPRNMHRSHRVDVTDLVGGGPVELAVDVEAQLDATERMSVEQGPRVHTNAHPFNAVRKMASNFGWDWGPDLVTAGIWRPVLVERWHTARLDGLRTLVTVDGTTGRVVVHADVVHADVVRAGSSGGPDDGLTIRASVGGIRAEAAVDGPHAVVTLEVPDVDLWWPRGYGEQPLHDLVVTLVSADEELDRHDRRIGFRTVELDTTPDEHGRAFTLVVNGQPVFVKGANWIPDDCFPSQVDRARYARSIGHAVDAGMNLLRVWGGGIYESEDFYDVCDEQGLLVWQDVLFACAAYAEEPPLADEVVAEVTEAVTRLSSHASLAIWNGNNENLWGHVDWDWADQLGDLTWGRGYYLDVLPRLLADLDPTRPYSPGSPWSFDESRHPNDPSYGTTHIWDVWNQIDYTAYRDAVPRFVSEFGYQGPPTWATLTRAVHDEPLTPTSPAMASHQKAEGGDDKLSRGIAPHLDLPEAVEDWHWATSIQQARAVTYGIEHFRSWQPVCMGSIVWQLNDCWPVVSWAAVDGDSRRKPLWYALRHVYADRLLTIQPRDGGLALAVCNDTATPWEARIKLRRNTFGGAERAVSFMAVTVPARSTEVVHLADALVADVSPTDEFLVAETETERALWFFEEDRALDLTEAWKTTSVETTPDGYAVHVTAESLQRDICLLVDKVDPDATVDDMDITLLAGESHTFHVRSAKSVDPPKLFDPQQFLDPQVLRSINQLVHHP